MKTDGYPLDIIFQKLPMSSALFDRRLRLRRWNPTWSDYVTSLSETVVKPGAYLYELFSETEPVLQPLIDRALDGNMTTADGLRLTSGSSVVYWDAALVPWAEDDEISGFLLVVADVTERELSRQILERKVVDRTQKLSALYDVMTVAAEPMELKKKLDDSLQRVLGAVHAQAGTIQLLDEEHHALQLAAYQGITGELAAQLNVVPAADDLCEWVIDNQRPLILPDLTADQRTPDYLRSTGFRAYVGVPMSARGKTLGVLSVYRHSKRPNSPEDIALLDSVADQIATAVENTRLRHENDQLLIVEERSRLARELHDAVTQSLYGLTLYAETSLRFMQDDQTDLAVEYMQRVAATAQQALREMRLLLHNLRPVVLEQLGLDRAIRQRVDAVEKRVGIAVDYQVEGQLDLPAHVEEGLYHIVQESLNNALKHAAAQTINVRLCQHDENVTLTVIDDGRGFKGDPFDVNGGLGLISMRERVDALGGKLVIDSALNVGSTIQVTLNLAEIRDNSAVVGLLDSLG